MEETKEDSVDESSQADKVRVKKVYSYRTIQAIVSKEDKEAFRLKCKALGKSESELSGELIAEWLRTH